VEHPHGLTTIPENPVTKLFRGRELWQAEMSRSSFGRGTGRHPESRLIQGNFPWIGPRPYQPSKSSFERVLRLPLAVPARWAKSVPNVSDSEEGRFVKRRREALQERRRPRMETRTTQPRPAAARRLDAGDFED